MKDKLIWVSSPPAGLEYDGPGQQEAMLSIKKAITGVSCSGSTAEWLSLRPFIVSRLNSDIPLFSFATHQRRVSSPFESKYVFLLQI